jgi:integrase
MSALRAKMIEQMQLHRKAPGTQQQYVQAIAQLAAYYKRSPDQLSPQEIRRYLHYLLTERQLAWSSCNVVAAAIRFFYVDTLGWTPVELNLPPRPAYKQLPRVLSIEQLEDLFATTDHPKHRALLMTTYAAGLRVSEVVRLQIRDIESDPSRMLIRINHGKGNKDRYSLLSQRLLVELRAYWKIACPRPWLFPGSKAHQAMPSGTPPRRFTTRPEHGLASNQARASTPCATPLPRICSTRGSIPTPCNSCWVIAPSRPLSSMSMSAAAI